MLRFGTEKGKQLGEQVVGLLLVHLLEVGHPLIGHLRFPFRSREVVYLPTSMLPSSENLKEEIPQARKDREQGKASPIFDTAEESIKYLEEQGI